MSQFISVLTRCVAIAEKASAMYTSVSDVNNSTGFTSAALIHLNFSARMWRNLYMYYSLQPVDQMSQFISVLTRCVAIAEKASAMYTSVSDVNNSTGFTSAALIHLNFSARMWRNLYMYYSLQPVDQMSQFISVLTRCVAIAEKASAMYTSVSDVNNSTGFTSAALIHLNFSVFS